MAKSLAIEVFRVDSTYARFDAARRFDNADLCCSVLLLASTLARMLLLTSIMLACMLARVDTTWWIGYWIQFLWHAGRFV
jgi:hypothetical protein